MTSSRRPNVVLLLRIGLIGFLLMGSLLATAVAGAEEATPTPVDTSIETPTELPPVDTPAPTEEPTAEPAATETPVPTEASTAEPLPSETAMPTEEPTAEPTPALPPTIQSDKADYAAGELVTLTGANWAAGEMVVVFVNDDVGQTWNHTASVTAAEDGTIIDIFQLPTWFVATYSVRATGAVSGLATTTFTDAPPQVRLEQCRNGSASSPNNCEDLGGGNGWVTGNVGDTQGHLVEGYSIPYRAVMENLPTSTSITLTLGYDIKHSGKHALDYLTHYQRLEPHISFGHSAETVDPTDGISGISATTTLFAIPAPSSTSVCTSPVAGQPTASFNSLPASEREMTLFGGTITGISYASEGCLTDAQAQTRISVTFTVDSSTAVLAWGGHIARSLDWGVGQSAAAISGSPYHMALISWSLSNIGQQDRSLSAGAVLQAGTVIIEKIAEGGDNTFNYTATGSGIPSAFSITTSGGTGSITFSDIAAGAKTVTESTPPTGWTFTAPLICVEAGTNPDNGTTVDNTTRTANIDLDGGETITCTYTNTFQKAQPGPLTTNPDPDIGMLGDLLNDSATLTGGSSPTGSITFSLYDPSDPTCSGTPAFTNVVSVNGNGTYFTSSGFASNAVGTWHWKAVYSGDDFNEGVSSACADEPVIVFYPSVTIDKTGTTLSKETDTVTYTYTITNTSSAGTPNLLLVSLTDSGDNNNGAGLGDLTGYLTYDPDCDELAVGESCTFTIDYVVQADDDDPLDNTVAVHYHPFDFTNDITASDGHTVDLFQPSINLTKSAETLSKAGDPVEYTITLSNTSSADTPDLVCRVTDALLGNHGATLASGTDVAFVVPFTIPADFVGDDFVNTALVDCSPVGFPNVYHDEASWSIELFQPSVTITKDGPPTAFVGQTITYTYTITNTSSLDTPDLVLDSLTDTGDNNGGAGLGDLTGYPSYNSDCNVLGSDPGEVCTFTVDYMVLAGDDNPLDNTVTVHYHPDAFENDISDSDDHSLTILPPPGVGTPGFWLNHPEVWDGVPSNDDSFAGKNNFPPGDILYPVDSDGDGDVDGDDELGILIGDWNRNGICDVLEDCIFLSVEDALDILDSGNQQQTNDKRLTLARALIATWLNIIAGNESDCIDDQVDAGVDWLLARAPDGNPLLGGTPVKGKAWSQSGGEAIYLALDYYNNTGSTCALDRDIEIEVEKDGALTDDADISGGLSEGDTITYTYVMTNTGVAAVTEVTLSDPHAGLSAFSCGAFVNGLSGLAIGASATCTATYLVTGADIGAGSISNTATAIADAPNGHFLLDIDTLTITFP